MPAADPRPPWPVPMTADTPLRWLRLAGWLFGLFVLLTVAVLAGWTQGVDDLVADTMRGVETPWLVVVAKGFHWIGRLPLVLVLVGAGGAVLVMARQSRAVLVWFGMVAVTGLLSEVSKDVFHRERPVGGLVVEHSFSYPSGHSMVAAAAIGLGLAIVAGVLWPHRTRLFVGLGGTFAAFMGLSRIYLLAHWLTDVIAGLLFGMAIVAASTALWIQQRSRSDDQ